MMPHVSLNVDVKTSFFQPADVTFGLSIIYTLAVTADFFISVFKSPEETCVRL